MIEMPAESLTEEGTPSLLSNVSTLDQLLDLNYSSSPSKENLRHGLSPFLITVITLLYVVGIIGNLAALAIISRNETTKYKKQTLMLRCLAINDLLALVGSFILMYIHLYFPNADPKWLCIFRVVWRAFGLGSGCVSFVMALERWMALSHSFRYRKYVTQAMVIRSILGLWTFNALLMCGPLFGFGLWYDETKVKGPCVRYRFGTTPIDRAYAYLVFSFGFSMCICIVCCNLAVIRVLCRMGEKMVTRRYSRASCKGGSSTSKHNYATPDEISFARLMGFLSIFFVVCWCPQLLSIIAGQISSIPPRHNIYKVADLLIALNFTLDPYIYVVFRHRSSSKQKRHNQMRAHQRRSTSPSRSFANGSSQASKVSYHRHVEPKSASSIKETPAIASEKEYVPLELLIESPKSEETDKSEATTPPPPLYHPSSASPTCDQSLYEDVDSTSSDFQCASHLKEVDSSYDG